MLTHQRMEPVAHQLEFKEAVVKNVTISTRTEFMMSELKKFFQQPPQTGCKMQEND